MGDRVLGRRPLNTGPSPLGVGRRELSSLLRSGQGRGNTPDSRLPTPDSHYQIPSSSRASSDIMSGDQAGLQTSFTSTSPRLGRSLMALVTSWTMTGPRGQPSEVRVIVTRTSPPSETSTS